MFEGTTPEGIKQRIFDMLGDRFDTREGSYTDALVAPAALEIWKLYATLNALLPIVYPDESSGEFIDRKCAYYGIGRKEGLFAKGVLTVTGAEGTTVPRGTAFLTSDNLRFSADSAAVISGGAVDVPITAAEIGSRFNVAGGRIVRQLSSVAGITGVTNPKAAVGGTDPEADAALLARLYLRLREPATSGNASHYRQWALSVEGVGAAKVKPLANGAGTVTVLIASPDMGATEAGVVAACAAHIEAMRPIGAAVTVRTVQGLAIHVSAAVTVDVGTTKETVGAAFEAALTKYLRSISFVQYTVPYTRIGYLLAGIDGVLDYTGLTVNGTTANIAVGEYQVPQKGTVLLT